MRILAVATFVLACLQLAKGSDTAFLMPVPQEISWGEGFLKIDSSFSIVVEGADSMRSMLAASRMQTRLSRETGIFFVPPFSGPPALRIISQMPASPYPTLDVDESYLIIVNTQEAVLAANNFFGIVHGLETFLQLLRLDSSGFSIPAVSIKDAPRFPWRGLLIDVCRHWIPMDVLKRTIDGMAAVKLNVLHWHLSEDQGFRMESKRFPRLHSLGSDGLFYTQEQARAVVAYAADRGIRVVPEFDMPGHTTSWFVGHPELASMPGPYSLQRTWGVFDPAMDPTREEVYEFLDDFIGEMAGLFPDSFFHIGGDEVNGKQWDASPSVSQFKKQHSLKDNHDLQVFFNKRVAGILTKHDRRMIGWDEILHPELPSNIVVQSWRGHKALASTVQRGSEGILSWGYYLDHMRPAAYQYGIDPLADEALDIPADKKQMVLGGEACMWAEFVTEENIDSRIWPRTAAVAERFWSSKDVIDTKDMYRRLSRVSKRLTWLGLTHISSHEKMLERLTGYQEIDALQTLSDVLEPVKLYERPHTRKYTQQTPLNRLVDATRPESDVARKFAELVESYVTDPRPESAKSIRLSLHQWRENDAKLQPLLSASSLLEEIIPLSKKLNTVSQIGLDALNAIEQNSPLGDRKPGLASALSEAQTPVAELLLMIIPQIQMLLNAAP